ncbi:hypothetical protein A5706_22930 [Mycobacterium sp. E796]|nr:hypothetical protein A5706_22930 [Mycobacterium sp. E796]
MYTFTLYRCLGYSIEIHPRIDGVETRPDFLVTREDESMYVECTVVMGTDAPATKNPAIAAAIYDAINEISDPNFMIGVEFKEEGTQQPRRRQIKTDIGNWLRGLDPDAVLADIEAANAIGELGDPPEKDFAFHDWVLTCTAFPVSPDKRREGRRVLGSLPPSGAFWVRNAERIHDAVRAKGSHYGAPGSLDRPLIVAVLTVGNFADIVEVTDALFGPTAISYNWGDPSSVTPFRERTGYWRGPESDRGLRVSAVLFSHDIQPWSVASHLPTAVINPWADNRIDEHPPLPTVTATDNGEIVERPSNTTPHDVFGPNI